MDLNTIRALIVQIHAIGAALATAIEDLRILVEAIQQIKDRHAPKGIEKKSNK